MSTTSINGSYQQLESKGLRWCNNLYKSDLKTIIYFHIERSCTTTDVRFGACFSVAAEDTATREHRHASRHHSHTRDAHLRLRIRRTRV